MAFTRSTFSPVGDPAGPTYAGAPRLWSYKTDDLAASVDDAGYFNELVNELIVGDIIMAQCDADSTGRTFGFFAVNANDGTTVDVADLLGIGATDTN